jgi:hypothetical protein
MMQDVSGRDLVGELVHERDEGVLGPIQHQQRPPLTLLVTVLTVIPPMGRGGHKRLRRRGAGYNMRIRALPKVLGE